VRVNGPHFPLTLSLSHKGRGNLLPTLSRIAR